MKRGRFDDNSVDVFPFTPVVVPEDEREATLRLLAEQPDGDELAVMLGLVEAPPRTEVPKPKRVGHQYERKLWCDIHHVAREPLPWNANATRCIMCFREKSRKRYYERVEKPVPATVRQYKRKATDV